MSCIFSFFLRLRKGCRVKTKGSLYCYLDAGRKSVSIGIIVMDTCVRKDTLSSNSKTETYWVGTSEVVI